ncbi:MAG: adenylate/guanylate cyclase domain-containing protein, partial [Clostridia bacterium]|nr:adenylate/guanylate cyclase domain-containing protein [Clostridia bacterium]
TLQLALLFLWSAALLLVLSDRKVGFSLLLWAAASAGWVGICLIAYRAGHLLHVLWNPLAATVLFVGSVAANYIRAAGEKRRITATFGRYVDPAVLNELLIRGGAAERLGGELHEIAVLFVDIRGFTTMSETLDPPTVVEIINRYLTLTTECIMRYRGTLDKFVGDCTMAFWNAPLPQEDPVYLACCAAMDMVEGSKALGEELQQIYGRSVSFGVGVHYGPAVVGNIGAPQRMDYTAIGDTVNTAARLEANAPGGKVLISRVVADALGDRAKVTSLGTSIQLKGKAEGFETLTLDALKQ